MERSEVDALAEAFSAAGDRLLEEIRAAERRAMEDADGLRAALGGYDRARTSLEAAVRGSPEHFAKPRTRLVAGVRFGMRKSSPGVAEKPDDLAQRLRDAGLVSLVRTRETVAAGDLAELPRKTLRVLGVVLEGGGDAPRLERVRDDLEERLGRWRPLLTA